MTIRHLRVFITVVDSGSMTRAAEKLFVSQTSVSQTIRELEDNYDTKLFERLSRRLYITEEGKKLLSYARYIISSFDDMEKEMKKPLESSTLKFGASVTVGTYILSPLSRNFLKNILKLKLNL